MSSFRLAGFLSLADQPDRSRLDVRTSRCMMMMMIHSTKPADLQQGKMTSFFPPSPCSLPQRWPRNTDYSLLLSHFILVESNLGWLFSFSLSTTRSSSSSSFVLWWLTYFVVPPDHLDLVTAALQNTFAACTASLPGRGDPFFGFD